MARLSRIGYMRVSKKASCLQRPRRRHDHARPRPLAHSAQAFAIDISGYMNWARIWFLYGVRGMRDDQGAQHQNTGAASYRCSGTCRGPCSLQLGGTSCESDNAGYVAHTCGRSTTSICAALIAGSSPSDSPMSGPVLKRRQPLPLGYSCLLRLNWL